MCLCGSTPCARRGQFAFVGHLLIRGPLPPEGPAVASGVARFAGPRGLAFAVKIHGYGIQVGDTVALRGPGFATVAVSPTHPQGTVAGSANGIVPTVAAEGLADGDSVWVGGKVVTVIVSAEGVAMAGAADGLQWSRCSEVEYTVYVDRVGNYDFVWSPQVGASTLIAAVVEISDPPLLDGEFRLVTGAPYARAAAILAFAPGVPVPGRRAAATADAARLLSIRLGAGLRWMDPLDAGGDA